MQVRHHLAVAAFFAALTATGCTKSPAPSSEATQGTAGSTNTANDNAASLNQKTPDNIDGAGTAPAAPGQTGAVVTGTAGCTPADQIDKAGKTADGKEAVPCTDAVRGTEASKNNAPVGATTKPFPNDGKGGASSGMGGL